MALEYIFGTNPSLLEHNTFHQKGQDIRRLLRNIPITIMDIYQDFTLASGIMHVKNYILHYHFKGNQVQDRRNDHEHEIG